MCLDEFHSTGAHPLDGALARICAHVGPGNVGWVREFREIGFVREIRRVGEMEFGATSFTESNQLSFLYFPYLPYPLFISLFLLCLFGGLEEVWADDLSAGQGGSTREVLHRRRPKIEVPAEICGAAKCRWELIGAARAIANRLVAGWDGRGASGECSREISVRDFVLAL